MAEEWKINGEGSWNFYNDFVRNVLIFGVDNDWSFHTDNWKDKFLVLGEGLTGAIDYSTDAAEKSQY